MLKLCTRMLTQQAASNSHTTLDTAINALHPLNMTLTAGNQVFWYAAGKRGLRGPAPGDQKLPQAHIRPLCTAPNQGTSCQDVRLGQPHRTAGRAHLHVIEGPVQPGLSGIF